MNLKKENTFFVNIDTQKDFMLPDGKLYVEGADSIIDNLAIITKLAHSLDSLVLNTADWHNEDTTEISTEPDFIDTYPEHCMENTEGAEYITETLPINPFTVPWTNKMDEFEITHRNIILRKDKFSVTEGNPNTELVLQRIKKTYDNAIVYGVVSDVCVAVAINALLLSGFKVILVSDCIKELDINKFNEQMEEYRKIEDFSSVELDDLNIT